jgi:hypothetical protein
VQRHSHGPRSCASRATTGEPVQTGGNEHTQAPSG